MGAAPQGIGPGREPHPSLGGSKKAEDLVSRLAFGALVHRPILDEKETAVRVRTTNRVKRLGQSLALAATVGGFWLAAGAPLYHM